ncbi:hypothetical protein [Sphingomonas sp. NIBR02145]|uniref:hypothetical protein n=1 Tax=Sphingomonas sp. NIBR02145 TaxID=3014784 RepID=UPI0022B3B802|nr:hypothetical protein [Sphingomonas sp. NIBR02145]WHU02411.1 hypothetical protein O3305_19865 [Sphingomonas sp. NIBR02145]
MQREHGCGLLRRQGDHDRIEGADAAGVMEEMPLAAVAHHAADKDRAGQFEAQGQVLRYRVHRGRACPGGRAAGLPAVGGAAGAPRLKLAQELGIARTDRLRTEIECRGSQAGLQAARA